MSLRSRTRLALAIPAIAALGLTSYSAADPFLNLSLLARTHGSSDPFSNSIAVSTGDILDYQVLIQMAPIGTTNGATAITSLTTALDGVNSLNFNIIQSSSDQIQTNFVSSAILNTDPTALNNDSWLGNINARGGANTPR